MQFSFACHFNFINSISRRSALDTRKPRRRLGAKAQYFLLHVVALFSGIFHVLLLIVFPLISISQKLSYKLVLARVTVTVYLKYIMTHYINL